MTAMTGTSTLDEREQIQQAMAGRTVLDAMRATAETYGDHPAYSDKADGRTEWRTLTWSALRETARDVAAALVEQGVDTGATVAIMATNRIEHVVADHAALL